MNAKTLLTLTLLSNLSQAEVNMKDGSFYKTWVDLEIATPTYSFQLRRSYDSRSLHPGMFGYGWCSDFEKSLEFRRSGEIVLRDCKLKTDIKYRRIKENSYQSPTDPQEKLEVQDNAFLRKTAHSLQKYNSLGQLDSLSDLHGFHLLFQYGPSGLPQKIIINHFAEVTLKMDARRRLIQSVNSAGLPEVTYRYKNLDLVSMTNAWKGEFAYKYDDVHNLVHIRYPDTTFEALTYDKERDWILHIRTRDLCEENFQWTPSGPRAQKYKSSAKRTCRGRLTKQTQYQFLRKGGKLRISSTGGLND
jgi:hypothetical protein